MTYNIYLRHANGRNYWFCEIMICRGKIISFASTDFLELIEIIDEYETP